MVGNRSISNPGAFIRERKKKRLLVKKGIENIPVVIEHIFLIYSQDKIVYVIDKFLVKYVSDKNLRKLEQELDNTIFFRVNRKYLVNIDFIKSFKPHEKVKLLLKISIPEIHHYIVISQQTAPAFKKWIHDI